MGLIRRLSAWSVVGNDFPHHGPTGELAGQTLTMFAFRASAGAVNDVFLLDVVALSAFVIIVINMRCEWLLGMNRRYFCHRNPLC